MDKSSSIGTESRAALDAIDHLALEVDDIDSAVAWYQERFRCEVLYRDATWAMLEFSNLKLAFVVKEEHPPHLGIVREDAEKFGKLKQHRDGSRSCYLKGPGGNVVEVLTPYSLNQAE